MVLTANAVTGRGWVDPLFGEYSSKKEEMINGVRVKRLKTQWQITSTMYMLKNIAGRPVPDSIGNIVSLFLPVHTFQIWKKNFKRKALRSSMSPPFPSASYGWCGKHAQPWKNLFFARH